MSATFEGAPLSRCVFFGTTLHSLLLSTARKRLLGLDLGRILAHGEVWRLVTHHLAFESYGEAMVGILHLYWFRSFERMLGSRRFGAFALFACTVATSLATGFALALGDRREEGAAYMVFASGPYALIFSMYSLFYSMVPATRPKLVGVAGLDVSDKSLVYLCGAQLLFSGGMRSFIPGLCGIIAGVAYLNDALKLYTFALPKSFDKWFFRSRFHQTPRTPEEDNLLDDQDLDTQDDLSSPLAPQEMVSAVATPSEANVETLVAMGFDRERALGALRASRDNLEAAANNLLSG